MGFVFQKYRDSLPTLTAEGGASRIVSIHWRTRDGLRAPLFLRSSTFFGIGDRMKHKPRALSGGQQRRVAIARALVNEPSILLADEPTGNLDSQDTKAVLELLRRLNRDLGQTILMITHDQEAAAYGGRTIRMRDGQVLD